MMSAKITSEHLARKAIVYVRQSTAAQVQQMANTPAHMNKPVRHFLVRVISKTPSVV